MSNSVSDRPCRSTRKSVSPWRPGCHFKNYLIGFFEHYLIGQAVPMTRQSRAASTTSRVTVLSRLISLIR
ncbi:MAG TPA: hypothetical protein VFW75_14190, partial [Acetobacteraceae bacterium]|nr:hypothetical protein [Acetobacteraceae bacterium]